MQKIATDMTVQAVTISFQPVYQYSPPWRTDVTTYY